MRKSYFNSVDNFSSKMKNRIQDSIEMANIMEDTKINRTVDILRGGVLGFEGFQMRNPQNNEYATFGLPGGKTVGS